MENLFVYGSLRPGGKNERMLAGLVGEWRPGCVRGVLLGKGWGAGIGYPGLIPDEDAAPVAGFLFSSADLHCRLAALDEFEGPDYERRVIAVALDDGEQVEAWVYAVRKTEP